MSISQDLVAEAKQLLQSKDIYDLDNDLAPAERERLTQRIKALLLERDAVLVAHYYTSAALQTLADETGGYVSDSLEMARFGKEHAAQTLVVAGVRFMGETAKILSPEKTVIMPDLEATCSLDMGCPADEFVDFCDQHPERTVVVYANTSAAVKARADWVVTSSIAVDVIKHLAAQGEKILFGPDRHLGSYIREQSGADMLLWPGSCIVHEEFKGHELEKMKHQYPDAKVLVHPESPQAVIEQADVVGSTSQLLQAVRDLDVPTFIVATDNGIFHKMHEIAPHKQLLEAPSGGKSATCKSCAHCPWMAMNSLAKLADTLEQGHNQIEVDPAVGQQAMVSLERMLAFAKARRMRTEGDA